MKQLFGIVLVSFFCLHASQCDDVSIKGVGPDYLRPLFNSWASIYAEERSRHINNLTLEYNGIGSTLAECTIAKKCHQNNGPYAFAASGKLLHPDLDYNEVIMLPLMAGAISIVYNLPNIQLTLRMQTLSDIFYGAIRYWNDTRLIGQSNATLPHAEILVIALNGAVGEIETVASALSVFISNWSLDQDIRDYRSYWNDDAIKYFAQGSVGMVGLVETINHSIGFTFHTLAKEHNLQSAQLLVDNDTILNVGNSKDSVRCALSDAVSQFKELPEDRDSNCSSTVDYPFTLIITLMLNKSTDYAISCSVQKELLRFIRWTASSPRARREAKQRGFYKDQETYDSLIQHYLELQLTCQGESVQQLLTDAINYEAYMEDEWKRSCAIAIGLLITACAVVILSLFGIKKFKLRYKVYAKDWLVSPGAFRTEKDISSSHSSIATFGTRYTVRDILSLTDQVGFCNRKHVIYFAEIVQTTVIKVSGNYFTTGTVAQRLKDSIRQVNVLTFEALMLKNERICFLYLAPDLKGTLWFVLRRYRELLNESARIVLVHDIISGMAYLHHKKITHGNLLSTNCVVDTNWRVKIADWAGRTGFEDKRKPSAWNNSLKHLFKEFSNASNEHDAELRRLIISTDPNVLALSSCQTFDYRHDVYSFGTLAIEVFTSEDALFYFSDQEVAKLIKRLSSKADFWPMPEMLSDRESIIIRKCLTQDEHFSTTFASLLQDISAIFTRNSLSIVDTLKTSLEAHLEVLESKVYERTQQLKQVTTEMEQLLETLLPKEVAIKLRRGQTVEPEFYEEVSIYFSDIVGFTKICGASSPLQVVNFLRDVYTGFDEVLDMYDVYKVETVGDAYMVASGVPIQNGHTHAREIAAVSLDLITFVRSYHMRHLQTPLQIRVGLHSGSCMAGVIGVKMPRYCLFGSTVNTATKMESTSLPMKIQASEDFIQCLNYFAQFSYNEREWSGADQDRLHQELRTVLGDARCSLADEAGEECYIATDSFVNCHVEPENSAAKTVLMSILQLFGHFLVLPIACCSLIYLLQKHKESETELK